MILKTMMAWMAVVMTTVMVTLAVKLPTISVSLVHLKCGGRTVRRTVKMF